MMYILIQAEQYLSNYSYSTANILTIG